MFHFCYLRHFFTVCVLGTSTYISQPSANKPEVMLLFTLVSQAALLAAFQRRVAPQGRVCKSLSADQIPWLGGS